MMHTYFDIKPDTGFGLNRSDDNNLLYNQLRVKSSLQHYEKVPQYFEENSKI